MSANYLITVLVIHAFTLGSRISTYFTVQTVYYLVPDFFGASVLDCLLPRDNGAWIDIFPDDLGGPETSGLAPVLDCAWVLIPESSS